MIGAGTISYKGSKTWRLWPHPLYPGRILTVNWESLFGTASNGTKHQREYLKRSTKELMFEMILLSESRVGRLSPGTVQVTFQKLRCLVRWMVARNIWRFNLISEQDALAFLESRLKRKSPLRRDESRVVTDRTIAEYVTFLETLWILRDRYTSALKFSPKGIPEITQIISQCKVIESWKPVAMSDAIKMLSTALDWQKHYPLILSIESVCRRERRKWVGVSKSQRAMLSKKLYKGIESSDEGTRVRQIVFPQNHNFSSDYIELVRSALGASLLVILLFSGMRIGEVLSLRRKCLELISHSDKEKYWYVNGIAGKKKGMARKWILASPAVDAINFVKELSRPLSGNAINTPLFLKRPGGSSAITHSCTFTQMSGMEANHLLRHFIAKRVDIASFTPAQFHAHRARKTFARFVALRDKSALESLAYHYGHLYTAVLDRSYVGTDFDLEDLLRDENQREMREGLTDLLNATVIGGKAGDKLMKFRQAQSSFNGKAALTNMVDQLIQDGVVLAPCDWGYCVYAKDLSMCGGSEVGPNAERRSPSVCASCKNFAVTKAYSAWWERRYEQQEGFLRKEMLPDQTRRVVERQFDFTKQILSSLVKKNEKKSR
ncbi:hypothetical protein [uncultured Oxalicibacterium sp.]|uniref:hypothetical protein n=1 Tax=uncultured Oxalicibacterium sp. TaxID=1168540 RepID=UPI0025F62E5F|nr:hypothetical protein [uncultured Oxalicibacterium sp.]